MSITSSAASFEVSNVRQRGQTGAVTQPQRVRPSVSQSVSLPCLLWPCLQRPALELIRPLADDSGAQRRGCSWGSPAGCDEGSLMTISAPLTAADPESDVISLQFAAEEPFELV